MSWSYLVSELGPIKWSKFISKRLIHYRPQVYTLSNCTGQSHHKKSQHYIHAMNTSEDGGIIIFTFCPKLLALISEANYFEGDGSFKQCKGWEEWQMVIYYAPLKWGNILSKLKRYTLTKFTAITIAHIYHNQSNTAHYRQMFDELQCLAIEVAGTPIVFKLSSPFGNLIGL